MRRHRCHNRLPQGKEPGKSAFENWRKKVQVCITSITGFELLLGANLSSKREKRTLEVESLLHQHEILAFTLDAARKAAEKRGTTEGERNPNRNPRPPQRLHMPEQQDTNPHKK